MPALNLGVLSFSNPDDAIIIQPPVYHPFMKVITDNERRMITNRLTEKNGRYEPDFDDFEKIAAGAKMLILCNPHNPVGRAWTTGELKRMAEICKKNNLVVISDEIHCDLFYKPHFHTPFLKAAGELAENSMVCVSPSKTFNIAGLSSSAVIIPDKDMRQRFSKRISNMDIGANAFGMVAC